MMPVHELAPLLAAVSSLALAGVVLARAPRTRLSWSFAVGMLVFAAESLVILILLQPGDGLDDRLVWIRLLLIAGLILVLPWGLFAASLIRPAGAKTSPTSRWALGIASAGVAAASVAVAAWAPPQVLDAGGVFYTARLDGGARYAAVAQLLLTVALLSVLELSLRAARGTVRWRTKYLILGLGGIFLVRFYFLADALLFNAVMAVSLIIGAATVFVGNLLIAVSLTRGSLLRTQLTVSRHVLYRSVVVGTLGLYLFVVGALGWLLSHLGVPQKLFWGSLVVFVSAIGLAAILLSEDVRWRIKRFIGLHFYRSKYDYRQQWVSFTKRLGSRLTIEELAPELLAAVTQAVGSPKAVVYLAEGHDPRYHLGAALEVDGVAPTLELEPGDAASLRTHAGPYVVQNGDSKPLEIGLWARVADAFPEGGVAVPLRWGGTLTGLMLVGPERTRVPYTAEDLEFLATVGEQVAGAIVTARLSEALAQSREFDAFHRLTSFVIHDLKNSISALSLLSQNALANFDDPEFQRDAIRTLSRTVDRMSGLLTRLSSAPDTVSLRRRPVDLASLAMEATRPVNGSDRISVLKDLDRIPPVSGDPEALLRLMQNLVTNAVEALPGEGQVTIRTYRDRASAVFEVSDTGCGIPEDFLRKSLFAPFRSTKKGGWGIGLYQAKTIVEAHDGTIEVSSKEGEGTTFRVRLPLDRP